MVFTRIRRSGEAAGTTLFFWVIGIPLIFIGADRMKPEGLWATKKKPSSMPGKGHYARVYQFDGNGKITGHTNIWINDDAPDNADDADAYDYKVIQHYDQWGENTGYSKIPIKKK